MNNVKHIISVFSAGSVRNLTFYESIIKNCFIDQLLA